MVYSMYHSVCVCVSLSVIVHSVPAFDQMHNDCIWACGAMLHNTCNDFITCTCIHNKIIMCLLL